MRSLQILFAILFAGLMFWTEFQPIKVSALFSIWTDPVAFWALICVTVFFIVLNLRQYLSNRKIILFLPAVICLVSLAIIAWHQNKIKKLDELPTVFSATTYDIGNDGGFILEFKEKGYLKAEKRDHWLVTYYRGQYRQNNDTTYFDIPLDFDLGKTAIIKGDSLQILGDTARFVIFGR